MCGFEREKTVAVVARLLAGEREEGVASIAKELQK